MKGLLVFIISILFSVTAFAQENKTAQAESLLQQGYELFNAGHYTKAAKSYKEACDYYNVEACYQLALMHLENRTYALKKSYTYKLYTIANNMQKEEANPNYKHIIAFYGVACDLEIVEACMNLANIYATGEHTEKDELKAAALYDNACDNNVIMACANSGILYQTNNNIEKAIISYNKGCKNGDSKSCLNLVNLYTESCNNNSNAGHCNDLANMYRNGASDVKVNIAKAKEYYKVACDMKYDKACSNLSSLSSKGY